jgi:hypothetical protein
MSYTYPGHQAPQPEPQHRRGMSTGKKIALYGCLPATLVGLLVVGGCAVVGGAVADKVDKAVKADESDDKRAAKEDVELLSCKLVNEEFVGKDVKAKVKITNNGDKRANYVVDGEFLDDKGNKVDALLATVENLEPGKSSTQNFGGLFTSDQLEGVDKGECKILKVTRDEWSAAN